MAAENADVVRSIYPGPDVDLAALLSDDEAAGRWVDGTTPWVEPSFQGTVRLPGMMPVTFLGLDGLRDLWQGWLRQWASFRVVIEDVIGGGELFVVIDRGYGRRRADAPEEMLRRGSIWTVHDGRAVHIDFNLLVAEALAAVGQPE